MAQITCPNCGHAISLDGADYANIVSQVRTTEFKKELENVEARFAAQNEVDKQAALRELREKKDGEIASLKHELMKASSDSALSLKEAEKKTVLIQQELDSELAKRKELIESAVATALSEKEAEIATLKSMLETTKASVKVEITESLKSRDEEIVRLKAAVEAKEIEKSLAVEEVRKDVAKELEESKLMVSDLKNKLSLKDSEKELAVVSALQKAGEELSEKDNEITRLNGIIDAKQSEMSLALKNESEKYTSILRLKDEEIERIRDFKAKQSTKMIGESLEVWCMNQFNQIRAVAYPNAYFEKDNDARSGSKGDFIFRDYLDGEEFISIMFEMKNESETTATKHKNEDFFKELDKDRREKGCEYAILVSLLEADSDFYNTGIVDVSYRYEKMFVVRPQFFLQIISILRSAATNSASYRKQLVEIRNQNIDITNFESSLNEFKDKFGRNYRLASDRFHDAIDEIDKSIAHLQKIKDNLLLSDKNLRIANDRAEDLTIRKLTKNNPTMKAKFEEARAAAVEAPSSAMSHVPGPESTLSGSAASRDSASQSVSPDGTDDLFSNPASPEGKDAL